MGVLGWGGGAGVGGCPSGKVVLEGGVYEGVGVVLEGSVLRC